MEQFRKLIILSVFSGTLAGLLLFGVQHVTTFPLIQKAEVYESAAEQASPHAGHGDEGWHPAEGTERTLFTLLSTVVSAIGFSALLFGLASLTSVSLDWRRGLLCGVIAFLCIDVAPAFGLPPQPPGTAVADLSTRQLWWTATVVATAVGLWLSAGRGKSIILKLCGVVVLLLPHVIGAPVAVGENAVPRELMRQFAAASIVTTAIFWLALGVIGGSFYKRMQIVESK
jgi:cobalt transporter subunit CbtA